MKSPILGTYKGHECENCGQRYEDSKENCPRCNDANEDYTPRNKRFHSQRKEIKIVEGIMVKIEDDPTA